ncbi:hypothetical protein VTK73DRAFT_1905 [Phialemonium thermophilum]|uniref:Uncharacterized protein n=1 Tax=Phialemonium thermophilum TaxID=223376 RepID=A0ABR3Y251_9PEZI
MRLSALLAAATAATTVFALPSSTSAVSMAADGAEWTILSLRRACNANDTLCAWSFAICANGTPDTSVVGCNATVVAQGGAPASQSPGRNISCGRYAVTSEWSGQFGPENGFTTLSVVDWQDRLIAWPSYSDRDLEGGKVVVPDRSFAVQKLA